MGKESANDYYLAAIRGEDIPVEHMTGWHPETIVTDPAGGSDNYQTLWGSNRAWWAYHHNRSELDRVLDAWAGYASIPFMQDEAWTSHVYLPWKEQRAVDVRGIASHVGRDDVADAMLPLLKSFRAQAALSSGWQRLTTGEDWLKGYPCMMTGARSFASPPGPDGTRRYPDGRPLEPWKWMTSRGTFAGYMMLQAMGYVAVPREIRNQLGPDAWEKCHGVTAAEKSALRRICRDQASSNDILMALDAINDGPRFKNSADIIRTNKAVAWFNPKSFNQGSTHFMYFKIWFANRRPANSYWDRIFWSTDEKVGWGAADTSMRKNGRRGVAVLIDEGDRVRLRCQNNDGTWHHIEDGDKPGWFEAEIPGAIQIHVKLHKRNAGSSQPNATLAGGEAPVDPPDPPPAGDKPGLGRLRAAMKSLDRAERRWNGPGGPRQAEAAKRQIDQALARRND